MLEPEGVLLLVVVAGIGHLKVAMAVGRKGGPCLGMVKGVLICKADTFILAMVMLA